jgi:hypothetical protein
VVTSFYTCCQWEFISVLAVALHITIRHLKNLSGVWRVIAIIWTVLSVAGLIGGVYTNYAAGQMMQQLNTELGDLTPTVAP